MQGDVPMCHAVPGMLQSARSSQHAIPRAPAPSQRHGALGSCWTLQSVLRLKTELGNEFAIDFPSHEAATAFQWAEAAFA